MMKLTISKEDYLKAIAEVASEGEPVIAATIARRLKITPPAVTLALKRLQRDRLIKVGGGARIALTDAGRKISDRLRNRHHLIERMLTEMLGMEWYKVHDEAERLEHAVSDDLEKKLAERLGPGGSCPHGNEINKSPAQRRKSGFRLLAEVLPGTSVKVTSMPEGDRQLLEYFDSLGIVPGAQLKVLSRNSDGTLSLHVGDQPKTLGEEAASKVWVSGTARRLQHTL